MVSLSNPAGERGEKTGTESRKRKPKAEACELRLAEVALPKGSGLATVRAYWSEAEIVTEGNPDYEDRMSK